MAEIRGCLQVLDPISPILSENPRSDDQPVVPPPHLRSDTETYFVIERGPRYRAYAELREARLRRKHMRQPEPESSEPIQTPPKKQVRFQGSSFGGGRKRPSILAQSVPDFSSVIRKENRKPMNALPPLLEMTPPSKNWPKVNAVASSGSGRGSKSANAGEKKGRMMVRKSYACVEELKGLSSASFTSIGGGGIGGRSLRGTRRTILGSRQI